MLWTEGLPGKTQRGTELQPNMREGWKNSGWKIAVSTRTGNLRKLCVD
jgi:hypothetical protein